MKLIVGISGASGVIYGVRFLETLKAKNIETHLVLTPLAEKVLEQETDFNKQKIIKSWHSWKDSSSFISQS